jgi:hypothetical protein
MEGNEKKKNGAFNMLLKEKSQHFVGIFCFEGHSMS